MRVLALVLVALGALCLGYKGFGLAMGGAAQVPATVCGIILVSGLLLLATNGRRE